MEKENKILTNFFNLVQKELSDETPLIRFKHPKDLEAILDLDISEGCTDNDLEKAVQKVLKYSVKTNKATFRNQLYGATDPYGLAGAWVAEAFNTSQYTFEVAPAFTLVENQVLRHVLQLFGIPEGDGIFSPGGSISMFYALVAARFKAFPEVKSKGIRNLPEMIVFSSEDSHYSVRKAAHWLGFGTDSLRIIKCTESGQMRTDLLESSIQEELSRGGHPLLVNATAGTTVLGAIDNLEQIAAVCNKYNVWMHVDACWGGSLILSQQHKNKLQGIEKANSISWNPHKMAGAPLQCSLFLVRERGLLHEANSASAQYLFQQDKFYDVRYDTGDKSVQCGRKIDSFKLWVMWKARGDSGLGFLIDRAMNMAQYCLNSMKNRPGFSLVQDHIQCPNVCFWYIPRFMRGRTEDKEWWELIHKITPKIKEILTLNSRLMVAYSPLRHHKNFFRLALTAQPCITEDDLDLMMDAVQECGEMVNEESLKEVEGGCVINGHK